MTLLAEFRSDVYNNLAAASDASRWTPTMLETALRQALGELNSLLVYEEDFTVAVAGYSQDLSGIAAINNVLAVAYPWVEGSDFGRCTVGWRFTDHNVIYLYQARPQVGDVMRVRFSRLHAIDELDGASATTVPEAYRVMVGLWAAAFACEMRMRQTGELHLGAVALRFRERAEEAISHNPPLGRLRWGDVGL
jgi:hypothetical protein